MRALHSGSVDRDAGTARYFALAILVLIYMLSAMDRQLVAILADPIKTELGLTDTELGLLTGTSFALCYVVAGVPISWLADRVSRRTIIMVSSMTWSMLTGLCGLANNLTQMTVLRMAVGVGEAGGTAPSLSLLSDFFPPRERARASAIYIVGTPLGIVMGSIIAGIVSTAYGWRMAFIVAAGVGVLLTPLLLLVKEPPRGRFDNVGRAERMSLRELSGVLSRPIFVLLFASVALNALASLALLTWTPAFLMRSTGMNTADLAMWYSPIMGLALALGPWMAGWLVDRASARDPGAYGRLPAFSCALAAPALFGALACDQWALSLLLISLAAFLAVMYFGPSMALLHNLAPPSARTMATAILILVLNVAGLGLGPPMIGMLSDILEPTYGTEALKMSLYSIVAVLLASAASYAALARLVRRSAIGSAEQAADV